MKLKSVRSTLQYSLIKDPEQYVKDNIQLIKQIGPEAWNFAILNRDADTILKSFIEFKIKPNLPRLNLKKILGYQDYTLIFAIKHGNQFAIDHILNNCTVHPKLLVFSIITLSNELHSESQVATIKKILALSPPILNKMNNIMINAGERNNGEVIDLLVNYGGHLINRETAMAYLSYKQLQPYDALMTLNEKNHEALIQCLTEIPEGIKGVNVLGLIEKLGRKEDFELLNY